MKRVISIFAGMALMTGVVAGVFKIIDETDYSDATARNQGRHLVRRPNTVNNLYAVYHKKSPFPDTLIPQGDMVRLASSFNGGELWYNEGLIDTFRFNGILYVAYSAFPAIAGNDPDGYLGVTALINATPIDTGGGGPPIPEGINHGDPPLGKGVIVIFIKKSSPSVFRRFPMWVTYDTVRLQYYQYYGAPVCDFSRLPDQGAMKYWRGGAGYVYYDNSLGYSQLILEATECGIMGDTMWGVSTAYPMVTVEEHIGGSYYLRNPSVAMSGTDTLHVAYESGDEIRYACYNFDILQGPVTIGQGKNPSINWYGDKVLVTWTQGSPGEVVERYRYLWEDYHIWHPAQPDTISNTPTQDSDYPVIPLRGDDEVWQEKVSATNWEVYYFDTYTNHNANISNTTLPSRYPHAAPSYINDPFNPNTTTQFTLWTDSTTRTSDLKFDIMYRCSTFVDSGTGIPESRSGGMVQPAYYHIDAGGSEPSPYCLKRDGYLRLRTGSVDYGYTTLTYRLPYLQPYMHYLAQIVVSIDTLLVQSPIALGERLIFDEKADTVISLQPGKPETLYYVIPQELYHDWQVILRIEGTNRNPVVLEDLKLYQFEILKGEAPIGGGPQSEGTGKLAEVPTLNVSQNPFDRTTEIYYQVTRTGDASLKIYDATGRIVKILVRAKSLRPGAYRVVWNGKSDDGKDLSNGIYFLRLFTDGFSITKKVVLTR